MLAGLPSSPRSAGASCETGDTASSASSASSAAVAVLDAFDAFDAFDATGAACAAPPASSSSSNDPRRSSSRKLRIDDSVRNRMPVLAYMASSWLMSFSAYGIWTRLNVTRDFLIGMTSWIVSGLSPEEVGKGPSHNGHTNNSCRSLKIGIVPHPLQIQNSVPSERFIIDSCRNPDTPCAISESRSISPIRIPPSLPRPPVGWCVFCSRRPAPRALSLSCVKCLMRMKYKGPINTDEVNIFPVMPLYRISSPLR